MTSPKEVLDSYKSKDSCPECGSLNRAVVRWNDYDICKEVTAIACADCGLIFDKRSALYEPIEMTQENIEKMEEAVKQSTAKEIKVLKAKADAFDTIMRDEAMINYFDKWYLKDSENYKTIKKGIDAYNRGEVDD